MKTNSRDSASTVVLIPGLGNNERLWSDQVAFLAGSYDVVVADYLGSDSIQQMTARVLAQTPDGPLSLVGFSLGSYVALDIVSRYPERVERLALISASPFADTEDTKSQRRRLIEKAAHGYSELLQDMANFVVAPAGPHAADARRTLVLMGDELGADEFARQQRAAMERPDCRGLLQSIRCPTRVLCGNEDPVTPVNGNRYLADNIPNATLTILDDVGHLLPLESPRAVNQFLHDWLLVMPN